MSESAGEVILYRSDDGGAVVQLRAVDGTVWLPQAQIAELYDTSVQNVQQVIARVLADGEVGEATINSELIVRTEGSRQVRREVKVYNLDMILAVGYRVTTNRAVQFRQWATTVLREYLVKGFALQDERLKDADAADYFDELLLWKGAQIRRADVGVAKNYLAEDEIAELNRLTTMFLDFAEDRAKRRRQTLMSDWVDQADRFLDFNERAVLRGAGQVSADNVERTIGERYADFDGRRRAQDAEHAAEEASADLTELVEIERRRRKGGAIDDP